MTNETLELFQPIRSHFASEKFVNPVLRINNIVKSVKTSTPRCQVTLLRVAVQYLKLENGDKVIIARIPSTKGFCIAYVPINDKIKGHTLCGQYKTLHFDSKPLLNKLEDGYYELGMAFKHAPTDLTFYPLQKV